MLATGPSMSQATADYVRARHPAVGVVAVCNAYVLAPWADAIVCNDHVWWTVHHAALKLPGRKFCGQMSPGTEFLPSHPRFPAGTNSGLQGLRVAEKLGASRIVMLGFDMQGSHFFGAHPAPLRNSSDKKHRMIARQFRLWRGVPVLNCTPGSALKAFPMADLKDALP